MVKIRTTEIFYQTATLLWIVTFCIAVTINFRPLYWWFIEHKQLASLLGLSSFTLKQMYQTLLAYLNYPWVTKLTLDISISYDAMRHFEDVKRLFLINYSVLFITTFPTWHYLTNLFKQKRIWILYQKIVFCLYILSIILVCLVLDFERFFIFFHRLLFTEQNWIFDPQIDPIILVLPSEFFLACFVLFIVLFVGILLFFLDLGKKQLKQIAKKDKK